MREEDFLARYLANAPRIMWFLGAGASRSAGLPTAWDLIWDLKRQHYCREENQQLQSHDVSNAAIRRKIQSFMESRGYPALGSPEEYSFYFELVFGKNYAAQQAYLTEQLSNEKISLNIGHRVLAALIAMGLSRIIFTTNFDQVIETASATVSGKNLSAFHLEGAYAATDALNAEQFPIVAKVHGDFRFQSIKNLSADLLRNDLEIRKCFLAASIRFGLVVSGYSGRDDNVMSMLRDAVDQSNAFPHGIFWMVPRKAVVLDTVKAFIKYATDKGIDAHLIEVGTFDEILSKIWRQIESKPDGLESKVRTTSSLKVAIPLPAQGRQFPLLRTNALPLISVPKVCGTIDYGEPIRFSTLSDLVIQSKPRAVVNYTDRIIYWGKNEEVIRLLDRDKVKAVDAFKFDNPSRNIAESTFIKAFFEEALATALCEGKLLQLCRNRGRTYSAVVPVESAGAPEFAPLRQALAFKDQPGSIAGKVTGLHDVFWAEAVSIKLEERNGSLWLLLRPDIWITPLGRRHEAIEFMNRRRLNRWNAKTYQLLDAWIGILLGGVGGGESVAISAFADSEYKATFEIGTRSGYSFGSGANGQ